MTGSKGSWEEAVVWLKNQPNQTELVRACFYDDPLIEAAKRYHESSEWLAARQYFPNVVGSVLDVGAGRGISSYALAKDGWNVTAIEPDFSASVGANAIRALAHESNLEIKVEENWGERLPFPDNFFDLVHARQVLHHAHNLKQFCSEATRVLKKGGTFIATREHVISRHEDIAIFWASHPLHNLYGGENAYLLQEYLDAITQSGITLTSVLNPNQSDINLYPETVVGLRRKIAKKIGLPVFFVPITLLNWRGALSHLPGRLYSFVGRKL